MKKCMFLEVTGLCIYISLSVYSYYLMVRVVDDDDDDDLFQGTPKNDLVHGVFGVIFRTNEKVTNCIAGKYHGSTVVY